MGETLNSQRNQQRNSNNKGQQQQQKQQIHCEGSRERDKSNKDIIKYIAAYLSLSQFVSTLPLPLPPATPSTQPFPAPTAFFLVSSLVYRFHAAGFF